MEDSLQFEFDPVDEFLKNSSKPLVVDGKILNTSTRIVREFDSELAVSLIERFALVEHVPVVHYWKAKHSMSATYC